MAREQLEILTCDAPGCEQTYTGPRSTLLARARAAGWQARAVTTLWVGEDGPDLAQSDRCPAHHVAEISREDVLRRAGGPGGVQPWHLP